MRLAPICPVNFSYSPNNTRTLPSFGEPQYLRRSRTALGHRIDGAIGAHLDITDTVPERHALLEGDAVILEVYDDHRLRNQPPEKKAS